MYRVAIVDNEMGSVTDLKEALRQDDRRFSLVYVCPDPRDALERICALHPDIVFADMDMPEMSGVELIRAVHDRGIQAEFVILSRSGEFDHFRQAMQASAIDCERKPLDPERARDLLDRVYGELEDRKIYRDLKLYSLLRDRRENVARLLQSRFPDMLYEKLQIVVLMCRPGVNRIDLELGENAQYLFLKIGPRKSMCIVNSREDKTEQIRESLEKQLERFDTAAISRTGDAVEKFEVLCSEAESASWDAFVYPGEKILQFRLPRPDLIDTIETEIHELYESSKYIQINRRLTGMDTYFAENGMSAQDAVRLWNRTALFVAKHDRGNTEPLAFTDVFVLTERFSDLREMCLYLNHHLLEDKDEESRTANDKFFEMLHYINENYGKPLYLKELCSRYYINMSYCCELFQKHQNMTFSQYVTHVRIRKACELLRFQTVSVSEVCEQVGYKDYFYFNKVFKKKMGCTPAEYRRMNERVSPGAGG